MASRKLLAVCAVLTIGSAVIAQSPIPKVSDSRILPFEATETTLPNGLKVIVVPTGFPDLASVQVAVQVGSRNEVDPGKSGFAHFFEHLWFRGTPTTPPDRYLQIMARAGARDNAVTSDDRTIYHATFAAEDLETIVAVYADMFQNLAYSEAVFKTEAQAVLGEYNKNSADPTQRLYEAFRERLYERHPYKHTTLGFLKDIQNFPNEYAYSKEFFKRWYQPRFTTLIVAGDVTPDRVLEVVKQHWGSWANSSSAAITIPQEPAPSGPKYAHVTWPSDTLPWVIVGFPAPPFDERGTEPAAMDVLAATHFSQTSDVYKRLVVTEQKVDRLEIDNPSRVDRTHIAVYARVKKAEDVAYVRDRLLSAFREARTTPPTPQRLADTQAFLQYSLSRTIDSTERVATVVAQYAAYRRSFQTVNNYYKTMERLTPKDVIETARKYFTDAGLVTATLSRGTLPAGIERAPSIERDAETERTDRTPASTVPVIVQTSRLPQLNVQLLFAVGSGHDPAGKEGLAALTASMITEGGSKARTIDEIETALYPKAASFTSRTDKEMTTFTGVVHRDHWQPFADVALAQLLDPGWRVEDFTRIKARQLNALVQDLRSNNDEELGKERLQTNVFRGTPYGHVSLGTVAGLNAITLQDVQTFARQMYTTANLTVGIGGDASEAVIADLRSRLMVLPSAPAAAKVAVDASRPSGISVEILQKETRATAISFGFPIEVTRAHPDFAALSVARSWLGEHRMPSSHLYQRIREIRGMNYGDYAYIEAFPGGMFTFFPSPHVGRRRQLFEIWIRPVEPQNAHMALRIALHELRAMIQTGLTPAAFEATRNYLMKNVYVMTARQEQRLGYALDSQWYGIGEFTSHMRTALRALTLEQVNAAIRRHLTGENLAVVIVAKDAERLKEALVADAFSPIRYDSDKPKEILDEDTIIGALPLRIPVANVRITPIEDVFTR